MIIESSGASKKDNLIPIDAFPSIDIPFPVSVDNPYFSKFNDCFIFPGFSDVHVHLREPGFSYKETIACGTAAAANGGYTSVCTMPNLDPVPDSRENLEKQLEIIKRDAKIKVYPYGAVTIGENGQEISDMEGMAKDVIAFSDDGKGIQDAGIMREAMQRARALGKIIAAHCEVNELLRGGYIHDGRYAKAHGHKGICSESEYVQIERDVTLASETGCKYHVCHVSTKESVEIIRNAKKSGVDVTCETAPHYLVMCEDDLKEDGRFKMNPPLRSEKDKNALLEGIIDGTIDMIATDHAPHSKEEKSKGLAGSAMGIVGLETAFAILYTGLVRKNIINLEKLSDLMSVAPRRRFGIPGGYANGDYTVFALGEKYTINPEKFLSKGRATPFENKEVFGLHLMTATGGNIV